jgi:hypothetical protein
MEWLRVAGPDPNDPKPYSTIMANSSPGLTPSGTPACSWP